MKKILILTSTGGSGHLSMSKALDTYLSHDYEIQESYILRDMLKGFDFIRTCTFGKYNCEDFYNYFIRQKKFYILNLLYVVGGRYIKLKRKKIYSCLRKHIQSHQPDLIISVIPVFNGIISDVAQSLQLPFLLIPADLDPTTYLTGFEKPLAEKFNIAIPFDDQEIINKLTNAGITHDKISVIGALLRQDFFQPKNKEQLKHNLHISDNKNVLMLLMGGQGSLEMTPYINELIKLKIPTHLLICIGKNEKIRQTIENIKFPNHISKSIIGFSDEISDLMAISDLLITKSGSQTVCEAIYMNTPILFDTTAKELFWEQFNLSFVQKNNFGELIKDHRHIAPITESLLSSGKVKIYRDNLTHFEKKDSREEINKLITKILA